MTAQQQNFEETAFDTAALPRTALIGAGSMGGAILNGLLSPEVDIALPIAVTTHSAASAQRLSARCGAAVTVCSHEDDAAANQRAVAGVGVVVLAVKPWMIVDTAREIAASLQPGAIVVSVAAGVSSAQIERVLPQGVAVVRAMPNTPATLGLGVTGIAAGASASARELEIVRRLFATVGSVLVVDETQINDVAAVSGSGPAYVFLLAEAMIAAAQRRGFSAAQSRELVAGTIAGAAALLTADDTDVAQLRKNVTSPKGTTEQAIAVLERGEWGALFDAAYAANVRRSEELEAANDSQ